LVATDQHLSHADPEIRLVELVRNVPAERTELATLLHQGVEEAQSEQHLLPSLLLHATRYKSCMDRTQVRATPPTVVFITTATAIYSLWHGLLTLTAVPGRLSLSPSAGR